MDQRHIGWMMLWLGRLAVKMPCLDMGAASVHDMASGPAPRHHTKTEPSLVLDGTFVIAIALSYRGYLSNAGSRQAY